MDYSDMKATKVDKSEKLKNLTSSISSTISKNSNTTKKKSSRTSSTKKQTSQSSVTTRKSPTRRKSSSGNANRKSAIGFLDDIAKNDVNFNVSFSSSTARIIKRDKENISKAIDKNITSVLLVVIFLIIGVVGGYFGCKYWLKNDVYEMVAYSNGEVDIVIEKGETGDSLIYNELGVKCIAFGKDISQSYTVKYYYRNDNTKDEVEVKKVDTSTEGIYYAVYSVPTIKYKTVKLIRNIIVLREEDDG